SLALNLPRTYRRKQASSAEDISLLARGSPRRGGRPRSAAAAATGPYAYGYRRGDRDHVLGARAVPHLRYAVSAAIANRLSAAACRRARLRQGCSPSSAASGRACPEVRAEADRQTA